MSARDQRSPMRSSTVVLTVRVNRNEYLPEYQALPYEIEGLSESTPIGTTVGGVRARDRDRQVSYKSLNTPLLFFQ